VPFQQKAQESFIELKKLILEFAGNSEHPKKNYPDNLEGGGLALSDSKNSYKVIIIKTVGNGYRNGCFGGIVVSIAAFQK
jgi:hypothetical protein